MTPDKEDQKALALWAADCAERVLLSFETRCPDETIGLDMPSKRLVPGYAAASPAVMRVLPHWLRTRLPATLPIAQPPALPPVPPAMLPATAHVAGHARHAAAYAVKAVTYAAGTADADAAANKEREWQVRHLPKHLRSIAFPDQ